MRRATHLLRGGARLIRYGVPGRIRKDQASSKSTSGSTVEVTPRGGNGVPGGRDGGSGRNRWNWKGPSTESASRTTSIRYVESASTLKESAALPCASVASHVWNATRERTTLKTATKASRSPPALRRRTSRPGPAPLSLYQSEPPVWPQNEGSSAAFVAPTVEPETLAGTSIGVAFARLSFGGGAAAAVGDRTRIAPAAAAMASLWSICADSKRHSSRFQRAGSDPYRIRTAPLQAEKARGAKPKRPHRRAAGQRPRCARRRCRPRPAAPRAYRSAASPSPPGARPEVAPRSRRALRAQPRRARPRPSGPRR